MAAPWYGFTPIDFPTRSAGILSPYVYYSASNNSARSIYLCSPQNSSTTEYLESPQQPSRTTGGSGLYRNHVSSHPSGSTFMSWLNSAGIEVVRVQSTATATFQLQYWNGATWSGVGASVAVAGSSTTTQRWALDFTGLGTAGGSLRLRVIGETDEIVKMDESASGLTLTSATNIDRLRIYCTNSSTTTYVIGEAFIKDGSSMTALGYGEKFTSNGTDTGGTGTYTAIDDVSTGVFDNDFISLGATGVRQSFRAPARNFSGRVVKTVSFPVRMRCGETGPTQVKPYLLIGGTRYYHSSSPVTLTTVYENYQYLWEQNPATAAPWTGAEAQAATLEFGIEVV